MSGFRGISFGLGSNATTPIVVPLPITPITTTVTAQPVAITATVTRGPVAVLCTVERC